MKRITEIAIGILFLLYTVTRFAYGADMSPKEILQHADRARGNVEGIVWDITMATNDDGDRESRGLNVKVKGSNTLAKFTSPATMNDRMVLMVDRNMWFIRTGLKKPVSLSPRQKLMGDAANGDIASTNYAEDYAATLAGMGKAGSEECYILDLRAANKNVTYDRIKYWVSKERLVGVKAEFYTLSGKLFKTADFKYDNRVRVGTGEEIPFISELIIRDAIQKDRITTMTYTNIRTEPVPDTAFNLNLLVR